MSKEGLLISPLNSEQSIDELCKSNNNNAEIKEIKEKFDVVRNKFSKEKIKELEQKDSLTKQEEKKKKTLH